MLKVNAVHFPLLAFSRVMVILVISGRVSTVIFCLHDSICGFLCLFPLFFQIKNLAADLCLDRALVLNLLRDPPPNLLMLSAAVPDKPVSTVVEPVKEQPEAISLEAIPAIEKSVANMKVPVHVMQRNWSAQKRIKKVQLETLERVYKRTKRPTVSVLMLMLHYLFMVENTRGSCQNLTVPHHGFW